MAAQANDVVNVIATPKGKHFIGYRGFMYTKKSVSTLTTYWRCRNRACRGTMKTNLEQQGTYGDPHEMLPHDHLPNADAVAVEATKSNVRKRAATELLPVPTLYKAEQVDLVVDNPVAAAILPSFR